MSVHKCCSASRTLTGEGTKARFILEGEKGARGKSRDCKL